ncbi:MAG: four helix bundle protein [Planctomycetota bacterium]|jgi:four helix bundle protein
MTYSQTTRFAHQRLDVYHVAMQLRNGVESLARTFPRGHADLKDQMRRAASSVVRHIAEGANRIHPRDKAARFNIAQGECGECDAALDMAQHDGLGESEQIIELRNLADRVGAMLCGLMRRQMQRAAEEP